MSDAVSAGVEVGETVECAVEQIMPYGAFVKINKTGRKGMIHISELSYSFVKDIQMIFCTVLGRKMKYAGEVI